MEKNNYGNIEIDITSEMILLAEKRNTEFLNKYGNFGTHRLDNSKQRMTGYLAEIAVKFAYPDFKFSNDPNVDFVYLDMTIDIKAQGCNSIPKPHYVATLYEEQAFRPVDIYIFVRVKNDQTKVWITGFLSKKLFLEQAKLIPAGTKNNNFVYDEPRYELAYSELHRPELFMNNEPLAS